MFIQESYKNLTQFLQEPYLIPKGTLHDPCKNLTQFLQQYLIPKGIFHDSYRNLSYKKLTLFLQEPYLILITIILDS